MKKKKEWNKTMLTAEINKLLKSDYAVQYIAEIYSGYKKSKKIQAVMDQAIKNIEK